MVIYEQLRYEKTPNLLFIYPILGIDVVKNTKRATVAQRTEVAYSSEKAICRGQRTPGLIKCQINLLQVSLCK